MGVGGAAPWRHPKANVARLQEWLIRQRNPRLVLPQQKWRVAAHASTARRHAAESSSTSPTE